MNISNENRAKIMEILNDLTKITFQIDYNKSESSRAIIDMVLSREWKQRFVDVLEPEENIVLNICSLGILTIYEKVIVKSNIHPVRDSYQLRDLYKIESENLKMLPYKYIMGGKIGKKDMLATLYKMI